jgi:hypothetical protein
LDLRGEEGAGGWRRLWSEELCRLYASPNTVRMMMSNRMKWAMHVTCMAAMKNAYSILVGKPQGKRPIGNQGVDGRIIIEWILGKYGGKV